MEIAIESTDVVTAINGVEVRLWKGMTAGGVPCLVYVHRIAVPDKGDNCVEFDKELQAKTLPPGPPPGVVEAFDLRKVL